MQPITHQDASRVRGRYGSWRVFFWLGLLLMSLLVSGCVQSDLTINVRGQSGGTIVERLQVSDTLASLNAPAGQTWLKQVEQAARRLQGSTRRLGTQAVEVTIPFRDGSDLERKLAQFLQQSTMDVVPAVTEAPTLMPPQLQVRQQNLLLLLRTHFTLDLDLRSLGVQSPTGSVLFSPGQLMNFQVALQTPWGSRNLTAAMAQPDTTNPPVERSGKQLLWTLQPGQINHLEAVYWYPSPVAWGAIAIGLLVWIGYRLQPTHDGRTPQ